MNTELYTVEIVSPGSVEQVVEVALTANRQKAEQIFTEQIEQLKASGYSVLCAPSTRYGKVDVYDFNKSAILEGPTDDKFVNLNNTAWCTDFRAAECTYLLYHNSGKVEQISAADFQKYDIVA